MFKVKKVKVPKSGIQGNGKYADGIGQYLPPKPWVGIAIPTLVEQVLTVRLIGLDPLITKSLKGRDIKRKGPDGSPERALTDEEKYLLCFYMMPTSPVGPHQPGAKYGIPASGLGKLLRKSFYYAFPKDQVDDKMAKRFGATCFVIPDETGRYSGELAPGFIPMDEGISGLINLHYGKMQRVKDNVRNPNSFNTPMTTERPYFFDWWADVQIRYDPNCVSEELIVRALKWGGYYLGLCERRPEKCGEQYGQFTIKGGTPMRLTRKHVRED